MSDHASLMSKMKTWPEYFQSVWYGIKQFEIRKNDRDYQRGDVLWLREYIPADLVPGTGRYTGLELRVVVTCVVQNDRWNAIADGFVVMGIKALDSAAAPPALGSPLSGEERKAAEAMRACMHLGHKLVFILDEPALVKAAEAYDAARPPATPSADDAVPWLASDESKGLWFCIAAADRMRADAIRGGVTTPVREAYDRARNKLGPVGNPYQHDHELGIKPAEGPAPAVCGARYEACNPIRCERPIGHPGYHSQSDAGFWTTEKCGDARIGKLCVLPKGHGGEHESNSGTNWYRSETEAARPVPPVEPPPARTVTPAVTREEFDAMTERVVGLERDRALTFILLDVLKYAHSPHVSPHAKDSAAWSWLNDRWNQRRQEWIRSLEKRKAPDTLYAERAGADRDGGRGVGK